MGRVSGVWRENVHYTSLASSHIQVIEDAPHEYPPAAERISVIQPRRLRHGGKGYQDPVVVSSPP